MSQAMPVPAPPTPGGDTEVDAILPELLKALGIAGCLALLYVALLKEWIVVGSAHRREVADLRTQRDKADDRAERLLDINATQSQALQQFAHKEDLGVRALEAIKRTAAEKGGGA